MWAYTHATPLPPASDKEAKEKIDHTIHLLTNFDTERSWVQNAKNKIIYDECSTSDQTIILGLQIFLDHSLVQKNYTASSTKLDTRKIFKTSHVHWQTWSNNEQMMQNSLPCWKEAKDQNSSRVHDQLDQKIYMTLRKKGPSPCSKIKAVMPIYNTDFLFLLFNNWQKTCEQQIIDTIRYRVIQQDCKL